jgi:rhodanese-related sulfurtransferase/DNA-binding transcriptional ArsR family regulator
MDYSRKRRFKGDLFAQFARLGRALSSPHRLELLDVLAQGERSVEQLAAETDLSIANASQHLQILRQAELTSTRRDGNRVLYRLASPEVFALWQALRAAGEARLAELDRVVTTYLSDRQRMEAIDSAELLRRLEAGEVTLLDVRPAVESGQGRIAGALAIPVDELATRMEELPRNRPVVAYCRGPYCVYADEAVAVLRGQGYQAARLVDGYADWRAAGFPVDLPAHSPADAPVNAPAASRSRAHPEGAR